MMLLTFTSPTIVFCLRKLRVFHSHSYFSSSTILPVGIRINESILYGNRVQRFYRNFTVTFATSDRTKYLFISYVFIQNRNYDLLKLFNDLDMASFRKSTVWASVNTENEIIAFYTATAATWVSGSAVILLFFYFNIGSRYIFLCSVCVCRPN